MLHRINKAHPAIWVNPSTLQIGLGSQAVRLSEITAGEQQLIAALYSGIVSGQEKVLEESNGEQPGATSELMSRLGTLVTSSETKNFGSWNELGFAEIARASLDYQVNGEMVLAERWQRKVHIDQIDKTGLLMTKALLASGIGEVITHDSGLVLNTDLGELGFPKSNYNSARVASAQEILRGLDLTSHSKARLTNLQQKSVRDVKVSFAVTVGHLAQSPRTYSRWLARDIQHIAITYQQNCVEVSPIVIPGLTACLNCYQEYLVDTDLAWPVLASQLLQLPRIRDDAASLLTATGLAVRSILRSVDEQAGFEYQNDEEEIFRLGYRVDYATGSITRLKFDKHSLCSCTRFSQLETGTDSGNYLD